MGSCPSSSPYSLVLVNKEDVGSASGGTVTPIPSHASAGAILEGPGLPGPSLAVSASPLTTSQQLQHRVAFSLRSEGSISLQMCQEECFKTIHVSEVSPRTYKLLVSHQMPT